MADGTVWYGMKDTITQAKSEIVGLLPSEDISIDAIKLPEGISPIMRGGYKEPYVKGLEKGIKEGIKQYRKQALKNLGIKKKG